MRTVDWFGIGFFAYVFVAMGFAIGFADGIEKDADVAEHARTFVFPLVVAMCWPLILLARCGYYIGHYTPENKRVKQ